MLIVFLLLFSLSGCIPTGQFIRTANPRSGTCQIGPVRWTWHIDQPEIVIAHCPSGLFIHGCTERFTFDPALHKEISGEIWTVDSAVIARHELDHAIAFSQIDKQVDTAEVNHNRGSSIHWTGSGGPAPERLC